MSASFQMSLTPQAKSRISPEQAHHSKKGSGHVRSVIVVGGEAAKGSSEERLSCREKDGKPSSAEGRTNSRMQGEWNRTKIVMNKGPNDEVSGYFLLHNPQRFWWNCWNCWMNSLIFWKRSVGVACSRDSVRYRHPTSTISATWNVLEPFGCCMLLGMAGLRIAESFHTLVLTTICKSQQQYSVFNKMELTTHDLYFLMPFIFLIAWMAKTVLRFFYLFKLKQVDE